MRRAYKGLILTKNISVHYYWLGFWKCFSAAPEFFELNELHLGFVRIQWGADNLPLKNQGSPLFESKTDKRKKSGDVYTYIAVALLLTFLSNAAPADETSRLVACGGNTDCKRLVLATADAEQDAHAARLALVAKLSEIETKNQNQNQNQE